MNHHVGRTDQPLERVGLQTEPIFSDVRGKSLDPIVLSQAPSLQNARHPLLGFEVAWRANQADDSVHHSEG